MEITPDANLPCCLSLSPGCVCLSVPVDFSAMTASAARSARHSARHVWAAAVTSAPPAGRVFTSARAPTPAWQTAARAFI